MHFDAQLSQANQPRTLIRNAALILTTDPLVGAGELGISERADLLLVGDKIVAVGEHLQAEGGQIIDATGKIVLGSLTPGKQVDVLILDPRGVNFAPRLDWINQIVFNGQPANIDWLFVHGRPLKAGRRVVGTDPTPTVQAAEEAARRLRNALHVP
jgi:cytosine/adenosine deaminase-related metal-dependent hydrolase